MTVETLVPRGSAAIEALLERVRSAASPRPFSDAAVEFCAEFAKRLGKSAAARRYPELTALAFWTRRTELARLRDEFQQLESDRLVRVPRGVVFHVPPANVDTMFVYSWFISLLCGNRNIVRLSRQREEAVETLCAVLAEALDASGDDAVRDGNAVISYGHEAEINQTLSAGCDTRVVWGGDSTVALFRQFPLAPQGSEVVFPDRFSFSVLRASYVASLDPEDMQRLSEDFFNDAFWFHQLGCSSPRMIVWCGTPEEARRAGDLFFNALAATVRRKGYGLPPAARMARFNFECQAILDRPVGVRRDFGRDFSCLQLESLEKFDREHCGGGLFFESVVPDLSALTPLLNRRDQTLTHFGFSAAELRQAAVEWNGRGLDRIVPVGRALQFERFWDGLDLFVSLTRCVTVEA